MAVTQPDGLSAPRVGAVVLNWNNAADTVQCLRGLLASDYPNLGVLVVDNASVDDSVTRLRQQYPDVTLRVNERNLGYTGGNNIGLQYWLEQGADYVLLINDDAVPDPGMVSALVAALQARPDAGCAGPKVYASEEPERLLSAGGRLAQGWRPVQRGLGEMDRGQYDTAGAVDYLSGCALLASRAMIERIGLLDARFFAYFEDVEWCYRAGQANFKSLYVPEAKVWHPDTRRRDNASVSVTYYCARNQLLFAHKHRLGLTVIVRLLAMHSRTLLSWTLRPKWRSRRSQRNALARVLWDYAWGRSGRMSP